MVNSLNETSNIDPINQIQNNIREITSEKPIFCALHVISAVGLAIGIALFASEMMPAGFAVCILAVSLSSINQLFFFFFPLEEDSTSAPTETITQSATLPSTTQSISPPRRIEVDNIEYVFDENCKIKEGANGDIYIATISNPQDGVRDRVAVKAAKGLGINEHMNEATIFQILGEHPSIVKILGQNPDYMLYLEVAEGAFNDQDILDRKSATERLRNARQIGEALQILHNVGITHNDVNLKNMLEFSGNAKLCDFGGSTIFGAHDEIQRPLTLDEQNLVDNGHATLEDFRISKMACKEADKLEYVKSIYALLVKNIETTVIPPNVEILLAPYQSEIDPDKYNALLLLFQAAREGNVPGSLDEVVHLLEGI